MPRRSRPPTIGLLAIAACLIAVVAVAAVVTADRQSVDTVPRSEIPTTECPSTTQPRAITEGVQMNKRFAVPVASAATAILLLGACGDDDDSSSATSESSTTTSGGAPTVLAKGDPIELEGDGRGLESQTLHINAEEVDGELTGEYAISENVITIKCADTNTDGFVILGGEVTDGPDLPVGERHALIIREGSPDGVYQVFSRQPGSCTELLLESIPDDIFTNDGYYIDVADGYDIETG